MCRTTNVGSRQNFDSCLIMLTIENMQRRERVLSDKTKDKLSASETHLKVSNCINIGAGQKFDVK
jgi:hypothetical protein